MNIDLVCCAQTKLDQMAMEVEVVVLDGCRFLDLFSAIGKDVLLLELVKNARDLRSQQSTS